MSLAFGTLADIFHLLLSLLLSRRVDSLSDLLFAALANLLAFALLLLDPFLDLSFLSFLELFGVAHRFAGLSFQSLLLLLSPFAHLILKTLLPLLLLLRAFLHLIFVALLHLIEVLPRGIAASHASSHTATSATSASAGAGLNRCREHERRGDKQCLMGLFAVHNVVLMLTVIIMFVMGNIS